MKRQPLVLVQQAETRGCHDPPFLAVEQRLVHSRVVHVKGVLLNRVVSPSVCVLHPVRKRSLRGQFDPIFYQLRRGEKARPSEQAHGLPDRHHILAFGVVDCKGQFDRTRFQKAMVRQPESDHSRTYGIKLIPALSKKKNIAAFLTHNWLFETAA